MAWWERQRELAAEWIEEAQATGVADRTLAHHAATALLFVVEARAIGHAPGEPIRAHDSWSELDAYEILFENIVHTACEPFWELEDFLRAVGTFVEFLGRRGEIGPIEYARLEEEYPVWSERLLEVRDTGCWWMRDGTYRAPDRRRVEAVQPVDFGR